MGFCCKRGQISCWSKVDKKITIEFAYSYMKLLCKDQSINEWSIIASKDAEDDCCSRHKSLLSTLIENWLRKEKMTQINYRFTKKYQLWKRFLILEKNPVKICNNSNLFPKVCNKKLKCIYWKTKDWLMNPTVLWVKSINWGKIILFSSFPLAFHQFFNRFSLDFLLIWLKPIQSVEFGEICSRVWHLSSI